ncbi:lipase member K-like [Amblyomma americanum]
MDGNYFKKWFTDKLLPNIPAKSIVVMDNAPCHCVALEKAPTQSTRKADMQIWLTKKGVPWSQDLVRAELLEISQNVSTSSVVYRVDTLAATHGHEVLRLPPYHGEFDPIELVWSQVKGYIASRNKSFTLAEVEKLLPEALASVTLDEAKAELVRSKGYPAEEHETTTADGYILSLQRVPRGRVPVARAPAPPVLLVHGLLSSAVEWVINYPHQSLGFLLADAGYDVWLGNCRGTPYSRGHREYSDSDSRFWNFRLDEVGLLDLPALVDYVLSQTRWPHLFLVGFSQGNAAAWAMLADRPLYNAKIRLVVALAPVANMTFIRSPVRFLVPISPILTAAAVVANRGRLLVRPQWLQRASYTICESSLRYACAFPTFFLFGVNLNQLNQSRLAVYTTHQPAGASKRNVEQYAQIIRAKNFVKYNYGPLINMAMYGTVTSPAYDFTKITAPVALFSARQDFFANPQDVDTLRRSLPNVVFDYTVPDDGFSHLDFVLGSRAAEILYEPLTNLMDVWSAL